jgi:hypothetical protein
MSRISATAALFGAVLLSACQSMMIGTPQMQINGNWASGDGISVTTFQGRSFTTRYVGTGELLAQGSYSVSGNQATMNWVSLTSQESRTATCVRVSAGQLTCTPPDGQSFVLNRVA